jgi:hypothetical protein
MGMPQTQDGLGVVVAGVEAQAAGEVPGAGEVDELVGQCRPVARQGAVGDEQSGSQRANRQGSKAPGGGPGRVRIQKPSSSVSPVAYGVSRRFDRKRS